MFFKKREVPDTLPELISEEIEKGSENIMRTDDLKKEQNKPASVAPAVQEVTETKIKIEEAPVETEKKVEPAKDSPPPAPTPAKPLKEIKVTSQEEKPQPAATEEKKPAVAAKPAIQKEETKTAEKSEEEKSFFADLEKEITSIFINQEFESLARQDLTSVEMLDQIKGYWSSKKEVAALEMGISKLHTKIVDRISTLKILERAWQDVYFEMIEKEERIKEEEIALKELLREFTDMYKRKKDLLNKPNGEDKNKKEETSKKVTR